MCTNTHERACNNFDKEMCCFYNKIFKDSSKWHYSASPFTFPTCYFFMEECVPPFNIVISNFGRLSEKHQQRPHFLAYSCDECIHASVQNQGSCNSNRTGTGRCKISICQYIHFISSLSQLSSPGSQVNERFTADNVTEAANCPFPYSNHTDRRIYMEIHTWI